MLCGGPRRRSMVTNTPEPDVPQSSIAHNQPYTPPEAAILRIPPEIVLTIFEHVLAGANYNYLSDIPRTRWKLMLVCRHFCTIVASYATLWTFVPVAGPFPNFCAIDRALLRAGTAHLQFYLDLRLDSFEENWCNPEMVDKVMTRYILPKISQVEKLIFIVDDTDIVDHIFSYISTCSAPTLMTFKLVVGDLLQMESLSIQHPSTASCGDQLFFAGEHPKLTTLSIHFVPIYSRAVSTSSIRHLDLSLLKAIDPSFFIDFMTSVDYLESLTLRNAGPAFEHRTSQSPVAHLPFLRRLAIGGMSLEYVEYLLTVIRVPPLKELGVFAMEPEDCDDLWSIFARYNSQYSVFNELEMLELFQVTMSNPPTSIYHPFAQFLSSLQHLRIIRMRRITADYIEALSAREDVSWALEVMTLEVLEISSVVLDKADDDDFEPVPMQDVVKMLLDLFERRSHHWNVKRLHLGDEWDEARQESLLISLRTLGEWTPIVHWDARAPFFHDYYDSEEI
ncbi:hypothetical protein FRB91_004976 [Serendipita sp. 411]|nr:hypothetical protein FRB91_004976 [Serendipita sp. 411]